MLFTMAAAAESYMRVFQTVSLKIGISPFADVYTGIIHSNINVCVRLCVTYTIRGVNDMRGVV